MADTGASSSSAVDPTSSVPVLVSIKYLDGENQGHINYHYLFPPPPVWVMSEHGLKIFAVVDCPLLTADKQEEKEHLLDLDIGEVLYLMEESLMDFYSLDAEDVGLDSDECAIFVTEYDEVELFEGTTLRKLIAKFLETNPISGSPMIISLIDTLDEWEDSTEWEYEPE